MHVDEGVPALVADDCVVAGAALRRAHHVDANLHLLLLLLLLPIPVPFPFLVPLPVLTVPATAVARHGDQRHDAGLVAHIKGHRLRARGRVDVDGLGARVARDGGPRPRHARQLAHGVVLEQRRRKRHLGVLRAQVAQHRGALGRGEERERARRLATHGEPLGPPPP